MDVLVSIINAIASACIAATLIAAMLSKRIHDGVIVKVGLGCMALGFVVCTLHMLRIGMTDIVGLERSMLFINSGIAVVIIGYVSRCRGAGHALRRLTDWTDIEGPESRP